MGKVTFNINYATGDSSASGTNKTAETEQATQAVTQAASQQTSTESYILNTKYNEISSAVLFIGQTDEGEQ